MELNSTVIPSSTGDSSDIAEWTLQCEKIATYLNTHYVSIEMEPYILLVIVIIGMIGNAISVVVYSHKNMNSPINMIFRALAFTDLFLLIFYVVELMYDIRLNSEAALRALNAENLIFLFLILRLSAMWLTTALTYWRYVALAYPLHNKIRCNLASCRKSVIGIYLLSFFINLPFLFLKRARKPGAVENTNEDASYFLWLYSHGEVYFWFYRSLLVLFSMTLLIVMSIGLFSHVRKTRSSRKDLPMSANGRKNEKMMRINKMILTVVILYLITEFLCIISCLNRVGLFFIKSNFYNCVDSIRILKLSIFSNPCINTLCYLLMSSQYRQVLKSSFRSSARSLLLPTSHNSHNSNECASGKF